MFGPASESPVSESPVSDKGIFSPLYLRQLGTHIESIHLEHLEGTYIKTDMGPKISFGKAALLSTVLISALLTSCQSAPSNTALPNTPDPAQGSSGQLADQRPDKGSTLSPTKGNFFQQKPSSQNRPAAMTASAIAQTIHFRQPDGTPQFSLQFKPTGGKLIEPSGQVIANLINQGDGSLQLTDPHYKTVGYVTAAANGSWQIESPQRSKALFTFRREANGDAVLLRHNGTPVYQLTATADGGYTVTANKTDRYTVHTHKGSSQLQTEAGQTLIATDSKLLPTALASFGFSKLSPAQQAGLAYALATEPGPIR